MADSADRIRKALGELVHGACGGIHGLHPAKVVSQKGQSLDLQPVASDMPDMADVPIWHGIPGVEVSVATGALVLMGFRNGDPAQPFAMLWQSESLTDITIRATGKVSVSAGGNVEVEARGAASVKGATATVKADASATVDAPVIRLGGDGAVLGVARQTDTVQAGPFSGAITKGSLKVFGG